jgi:hypothetical protein
MNTIFNESEWTLCEGFFKEYAIEASQLGLKPGQSPSQLYINIGKKVVSWKAIYQEGDILMWEGFCAGVKYSILNT